MVINLNIYKVSIAAKIKIKTMIAIWNDNAISVGRLRFSANIVTETTTKSPPTSRCRYGQSGSANETAAKTANANNSELPRTKPLS